VKPSGDHGSAGDVDVEVEVDVLKEDDDVVLVEEAEDVVVPDFDDVRELVVEVAEGTVIALVDVVGEVETVCDPEEKTR
jgi:hypothetical protein